MNRRQKIIVSITGIFIVLLALIGLTYAYFLTKITPNPNPTSVSVKTANLVLKYDEIGENANKIVGSTTAMPGYSVTKDFTATNEGGATTYSVVLENVVNELSRKQDLVYSLSCTSSDGVPCNGITEGQFPSTSDMSILVTNSIADGTDTHVVHTYKLIVTYKEAGVDQTLDMNKRYSAKINLIDSESLNPYISNSSNSLNYSIINNAISLSESEKNDGYASYSASPVTDPANGVSGQIMKELNLSNTESTGVLSSEYLDYYWTYADDYTFDPNVGYSLVNPQVAKFSEIYSSLVGKYVVGIEWNTGGSAANELRTYTNLTKIYYVTKTTSNSITAKEKGYESESFSESNLSIIPEGNGYSYYYRGAVRNNYVNFAGMCWRIVRIESDGEMKLILEDYDNVCQSLSGGNNYIPHTGNNYVNFGYKNIGTTKEDVRFEFVNPVDNSAISIINILKAFQNNESKLKPYLSKLKSGDWCFDDKAYEDKKGTISIDASQLETKYGTLDYVYFDSYVRLRGKQPREASLNCNGSVINSFSDGSAMYVGLLTADEAVLAGAKSQTKNSSYYLVQHANNNFWTMSPYMYTITSTGKGHNVLFINGDGELTAKGVQHSVGYARPVIRLLSSTKISNPNAKGSVSDPYEVVVN